MELLDKAIAKSGVPEDQIEEVLMVGGATRTPLVRETVRAKFGPERVQFGIDPVECVGKGAAIYAARFPADTIKCPKCYAINSKANLKKCCNEKCGYIFSEEDITQWFECPNCHTRNQVGVKVCSNPECKLPFGELPPGLTAQPYGVGLVDGRYAIVMESGTSYPMKEPITRIFYTVSDNQKIVDVPIYCGEILDDASQNDYMGNVIVALENPVPKQTPVEVSFKLDRSQILEVAVEVKDARHSCAQATMQHSGIGKEGKSIMDEIETLRSEAGDRLTEKQRGELETAEGQVANIIMNPALASPDKHDQIRKVRDNVKRIEEEAGIRKDVPRWIEEARNVSRAVQFAHEKLGKLVDPDVAIQLPKLASNLDKAIELQDEEKCKKYIGQFEAMLRDLEKDAAKVWATYMKVFQLRDPAKIQNFAYRIDMCIGRLETGDYEADKELDRISLEIDEELRKTKKGPDDKKDKEEKGIIDQIRTNPFLS
jgi:molecular chaperone DnaK (HSP70)